MLGMSVKCLGLFFSTEEPATVRLGNILILTEIHITLSMLTHGETGKERVKFLFVSRPVAHYMTKPEGL